MNENQEDLFLDFSLSLGQQKRDLKNQEIQSNEGLGWDKFYCHLGHPIEEEYDEKLEIICTITKLMRDPAEGGQFENQYQLTSEIRSELRDLTDSHLREEGRLLALETDMKSRFNDMMQGQKAMKMEFKRQIDEVTKSMQDMKNVQINPQQQQQQQPGRFDDTENYIHYNNIPKPKCVECRSNLTSNSQIFQCPSAHLLCLICKDISGETKCPVCHEPISRATGLEGYLKILFPTTANFEFLSKDKLPHNISNVE